MNAHCYLCGKQVAPNATSGDHVVPRHLLERRQPKVRGFDYAGVLPSHADCNNRFGSERVNQKALTLIRVLHDDDCVLKRQHRDNPDIVVLALNSSCLPNFTKRDLAFFQFTDVREKEHGEWSNPAFFQDKPKTNALKQALYIALAVLTKSAAALLVARHLQTVPSSWRVVAIPYFGKDNVIDFDKLLGDTKPFDVGLKVWIRQMEKGDWFAIYKARDVVLYLLFWFSGDRDHIEGIARIFSDADRLLFEGNNLMDLVGYEWRKV
jgi:hypothetical protein